MRPTWRRCKINSEKSDHPPSSWNHSLLFSKKHFILHMFIIAEEQHSIQFLCSIKCLLSVTVAFLFVNDLLENCLNRFLHTRFENKYNYFELCSSRLVQEHNLTNIFSSKLVALLSIPSFHLRAVQRHRTVHVTSSWSSCAMPCWECLCAERSSFSVVRISVSSQQYH